MALPKALLFIFSLSSANGFSHFEALALPKLSPQKSRLCGFRTKAMSMTLETAFGGSLSTTSDSESSLTAKDDEISAKPKLSRESSAELRSEYDSIVCGGGPAGLLSAIMLSKKYGPSHKIAVCERRPTIPPKPSDETVWGDIARFYLLGIGFRGQGALREFGVFDDFVNASVAVNGRRDWQPGKTAVEDGVIIKATKEVVTRVLARDKLVSVLYHHILDNYADSSIDLLYGYEVEPVSFGSLDKIADDQKDDKVFLRIVKCKESDDGDVFIASQDAEQECDIDESTREVSTNLLVAADGSARTIANALEQTDLERYQRLNPLVRLLAPKPFKVKRYIDNNPRVYKSLPIRLPKDWPCDLNYSARSSDNRITLEALPSDGKGSLCALLLMKPGDELAQENVDPAKLRAFFDKEFPQFGALVDDDTMAVVATKPYSTLPAFRYVGPRLHVGRRTVVIGDAAHTVKPYYGLGANTALEDVQVLSKALDDAVQQTGTTNEKEAVPNALKLFSKQRAADSAALVQISRQLDQSGRLFIACFLIPLILDGIFHKIAPTIFSPNMFGMFRKHDMTFTQIQRKKRFDRTMQMICIGTMLTGAGIAMKSLVRVIARMIGTSQCTVVLGAVATAILGKIIQRVRANKMKVAER